MATMTPPDLVPLLARLVDIPSVTGDEAAVADFVVERLRASRALREGRGELLRSGHSIVWRAIPRGKPMAILAGHLDTVPPNQNAGARIEGDRLYGLGSSDMKAGVAVMLALADGLDPPRTRFDLVFVFYDSEEGPLERNGLRRLLAEMPWLREGALGILLEPTSLAVELGCNGSMNAEVKVTGKSAHSARPWLGLNAVERAAPWLSQVTRFPPTPVQVQGIEFRETLQITTVRAGRAKNVVPDELVANLNYRFPPDRTLEQAEARLRALVPADFEFAVVDRAAPGLVCADAAAVRDFLATSGTVVRGKQGWTDVAQLTAAGIPAFNFGPGIPEMAHQRDEYCPTENLERAHRVLTGFLQEGAR